MNKNSGITLIALIITIIVLLILTGITIATITGDNGVLNKAKMASEDYDRARREEEQRLKDIEGMMEAATNIWNGEVATKFAKGEGTEANPYIISTGAELAYFSEQVNSGNKFAGKYIEITESIDLNNQKIRPIGIGTSGVSGEAVWNFANAFDGYLNGNGNIITGLNIQELETHGVGLIGVVGELGVVENLNIYSGTIKGKTSVGAIAGVNSGTIRNCSNKANIIAQDNAEEENSGNMAGGIVGWCEKGIVENCTNYGSVITKNDSLQTGRGKRAGGIIGAITSNYDTGSLDIKVSGCVNKGEVISMSQSSGGIVGYVALAYRNVNIENCVNEAKVVSQEAQVGGIVGGLTLGSSTITSCENIGEIVGEKNYVGGIVGLQQVGTISNSTNSGKIISKATNTQSISAVGGISGTQTNGTVEACINKGNISAQGAYAGGIVGYQGDSNATGTPIITNCTNTAEVVATQNCGGITGISQGNISIADCSNSGTIKGNTQQVGGIAGRQEGGNIEKVSNTGTIIANAIINSSGRGIAGGIVGTQAKGTLTEAYNSGNVEIATVGGNGIDSVGGIVGYLQPNGSVSKAYNKGTFSGAEAIGGIIGQKKLAGTVEKSYYYTQDVINGIGTESDDTTVVVSVNDTVGKTEKVTDNIENYNKFLNWIEKK